jgi:hypothetical protein
VEFAPITNPPSQMDTAPWNGGHTSGMPARVRQPTSTIHTGCGRPETDVSGGLDAKH